MPRSILPIGIVALLVSAVLTPAAADSCQLEQFASVPVKFAPSGHLLLDVALDGEPTELILDTGAGASTLSGAYVERRQWPVSETRVWGYGLTGKGLSGMVRVGLLRLGDAVSRGPAFGVANFGGDGRDGGPVGLFAADYLANYEVELDLAAGRIKLFSQDHCAGTLVFWAREYFRLPLQLTQDKRLTAEVPVDGRTLKALIDTGAPQTTMRLATARQLFDVAPPDGRTATASGIDGVKIATFPHKFDSLTFGGITLRNTTVQISDINSGQGAGNPGSHITGKLDQPDLIIGMSLLRQLHFLIAYSEPALYFTVGDQPNR